MLSITEKVVATKLEAIRELKRARRRLQRKPDSLDAHRVAAKIEELEYAIDGLSAFEELNEWQACGGDFDCADSDPEGACLATLTAGEIAEAQRWADRDMEDSCRYVERKPNSPDRQRVLLRIDKLRRWLKGLSALQTLASWENGDPYFGWPDREIDTGRFLPSFIGTRKTGYHN